MQNIITFIITTNIGELGEYKKVTIMILATGLVIV